MGNAHPILTNYLQRVAVTESHGLPGALLYSCAEDYVLDQGQVFRSDALSSQQLSSVLTAARRSGGNFPARRCFTNAAQLVLADRTGEIHYVEGFAMGFAMPVHHAWAILGGKVVDLTWARRDAEIVNVPHRYAARVLGEFGEQHAYIGIVFDNQTVVQRFADLENAVPFFDDPDELDSMMCTPRRKPAPWKRAPIDAT